MQTQEHEQASTLLQERFHLLFHSAETFKWLLTVLPSIGHQDVSPEIIPLTSKRQGCSDTMYYVQALLETEALSSNLNVEGPLQQDRNHTCTSR